MDMGAALCSGIPSQVAEVEARAALFSFLRSATYLSKAKNGDMQGASTTNQGSWARGKRAYMCVWELEAGVQESLKLVPSACECTSADDYPTAR